MYPELTGLSGGDRLRRRIFVTSFLRLSPRRTSPGPVSAHRQGDRVLSFSPQYIMTHFSLLLSFSGRGTAVEEGQGSGELILGRIEKPKRNLRWPHYIMTHFCPIIKLWTQPATYCSARWHPKALLHPIPTAIPGGWCLSEARRV